MDERVIESRRENNERVQCTLTVHGEVATLGVWMALALRLVLSPSSVGRSVSL